MEMEIYGIPFKRFMELLHCAMITHRWIESEKAGRDLGVGAECDWILCFAPAFRRHIESTVGPLVFEFPQYMAIQREVMDRDKWIRSRELNMDAGSTAYMQWIKFHAMPFREWFDRAYGPVTQSNPEMKLEGVLNWLRIYREKFGEFPACEGGGLRAAA